MAAARRASANAGQAAQAEKASKARIVAAAQQAMQDYSDDGYGYKLLKLIGKGAYGAVYLAEVEDGTRVAVKHIVNAFTGSTDARRIFREIAVMRHFSHPNIIRLRAILTPRDQAGFTAMWLVSDLMETDLHRVIHSRQDLTSDHISYFIYQLLCALQHLHSAGVLHRVCATAPR